jgi:hypothetical protein
VASQAAYLPFNQTHRQAKPLAPAGFGALHLAAVRFVVHAQQVEEAVQHQDADFVFKRVAECGCLSPGLGGGDGHFAEGWGRWLCRKREDIGRVVFAEEIAVEAPQIAVAGDEACERAILGNFAAQSSGEAFQAAAVQFRRGPAEQNYIVV